MIVYAYGYGVERLNRFNVIIVAILAFIIFPP